MRARDRTLPSAVFENFGLKVFSLVVAVGIFWSVRGAEHADRTIFVGVVAELPPNSSTRQMVSDLPAQVRLRVRGAQSIVNALRPSDIPPITIDLTDTDARMYYFDPEDVVLPAGVEVLQIAPATLALEWGERAQHDLRLVAAIDGRPREGLMLAGPATVRPSSLTVRGLEAELASLDAVRTELVSLDGLGAGHHDLRVPLMPLPAHCEAQQPIGAVTVSFDLVPEISERTIARAEVAVVGGTPREVRPERVRIVLRGAPSRFDALDADGVVPVIDVESLDPERGTQAVAVRLRELPEGIELVRIEPDEVLVTMPAGHR